jgi:hypothetical protein
MATDDDDILAAPVPAPDDDATPAERARAKTFGELVDKTIAGRTPPAMNADDRALLEVATVIRAASGNARLAPSAQRAAVEDALRRAVGGVGGGASGSITSISRARGRRWAPWVIAGASTLVAAAALLVLWLRPPRTIERAAASVPATWRSRPADALIGPIDRARAGDASARIDAIFADRLDGYRQGNYDRQTRRRARGGSP